MTYSTGTVAVTNGSPTVTGTGTAWVDVVRPGWLIVIGGVVGAVASVTSAKSITLTRSWLGATQSGAAYDALPTQAEIAPFVATLQTVLAGMLGVQTGAGEGKFADGTVGTPGIRFAADEDTGLRRKAANVLALVAGGGDRLEVTTTGAILTGLLTGTAVTQSDVDLTAGRLLKVGDYGIGRDVAGRLAPSNNLNNAIVSGWYDVDSSTANRPTGMNNGAVLVIRRGTNRTAQIATAIQNNAEPTFLIRVQSGDGSVWSPWRPLVPERGSNANGEFVRFADGTQICTNSNAAITTAPAAFTGTITKIDGDKLWIGRWF